MAHSMDLRLRAVKLLEIGHTVLEVSELLDLGTATLGRWKMRAREGRLATNYPVKRGAYKLDEQAMSAYLSEHPDAYQYEIAKAMGVSQSAVWLSFKRLGITRKKRHPNIVNAMKSGAENMRN
ncbi:MAG: hypothetical protein JKX72_02335 [Robiginitomaculum sp.]|nr:hypothetical protein [Robiginitomaculum sp.]